MGQNKWKSKRNCPIGLSESHCMGQNYQKLKRNCLIERVSIPNYDLKNEKLTARTAVGEKSSVEKTKSSIETGSKNQIKCKVMKNWYRDRLTKQILHRRMASCPREMLHESVRQNATTGNSYDIACIKISDRIIQVHA